MAARSERRPGALELEVLNVIWENPACTVADVAGRLSHRQYARTTILTVIQRLHAKGLLRRRKEAGVFRYSATQPRKQVLSRLIARFIENFLDGSPAPFVAYLTEARNITPGQRAALEEIVRDLEKREGKR
jgi:predicted transcriptional regulator